MKKIQYVLSIIGLLVIVSISSCRHDSVTGGAAHEPGTNAEFCTDPRPEVCTLDYTPVCGTDNNGATETYSNACGACSTLEVVSYIEGACE